MLLGGTLRAQTVTATVPVGTTPVSVAVNTLTNKIYVVNQDITNTLINGVWVGNIVSGSVTVIDWATTTTTNLNGVSGPIAINPVTNKIYVGNQVIDGATPTTTTTTTVNGLGGPMAINPVTNKIYVGNGDGTVTVIDGATNSNITTVYLGTCSGLGCGGLPPLAGQSIRSPTPSTSQ
jgi:YVTN family beta-propeller protein